jgi:hypothetical protein
VLFSVNGTQNKQLQKLIQGSLHCAAHGETVRRFGRDDVSFLVQLKKTDKLNGIKQATAKAKYGGLSTARRTVKLSVASVEMTCFLGWDKKANGGLGCGLGYLA